MQIDWREKIVKKRKSNVPTGADCSDDSIYAP